MEKKGKINILFAHHGTSIGGAEQSLSLLIRNLNKDRFSPVLLVPFSGWLTEQVSPSCAVCLCPMPPAHRPKGVLAWLRFVIGVLAFDWRFFKILRAYQVDMIYCNSVPSRVFTWLPALMMGTQVVWHIRDVHFPRLLLKYLQMGTAKILVASEFVRLSLANIKCPVVVIPNALNIHFWTEGYDSLVSKVDALAEDDLFVVCAGQLVDWKRHQYFLEVAELLAPEFPRVKFVIAGGVPSAGRSDTRQAIVNHINGSKYSHQLLLFEELSDLRWLFHHMALLVHPALEEPFGRVIIEAMAMEKPVVAMKAGGVAEIVVDGQSGILIEPESSSQVMAEKVRLLLHSDGMREDMGKSGRRIVSERFNVEYQQAQMEAALVDTAVQGTTVDVRSLVNEMIN